MPYVQLITFLVIGYIIYKTIYERNVCDLQQCYLISGRSFLISIVVNRSSSTVLVVVDVVPVFVPEVNGGWGRSRRCGTCGYWLESCCCAANRRVAGGERVLCRKR